MNNTSNPADVFVTNEAQGGPLGMEVRGVVCECEHGVMRGGIITSTRALSRLMRCTVGACGLVRAGSAREGCVRRRGDLGRDLVLRRGPGILKRVGSVPGPSVSGRRSIERCFYGVGAQDRVVTRVPSSMVPVGFRLCRVEVNSSFLRVRVSCV